MIYGGSTGTTQSKGTTVTVHCRFGGVNIVCHTFFGTKSVKYRERRGAGRLNTKADSHVLEELLYVCARADFLCEGVKDVKGEVRHFDLVVL